MKLEISEEIIQQTTKCDRDFACLKPDGKPSCSIKDCVSQKFILLQNTIDIADIVSVLVMR